MSEYTVQSPVSRRDAETAKKRFFLAVILSEAEGSYAQEYYVGSKILRLRSG